MNHIKRTEDQERQLIYDWLTPVDYGTQQSDFRSRRQEGTGQWLLNSDEFQKWVNQPKQTLFCPGIPGAGKTIMTSVVVDHLDAMFKNDSDIGIAYIYCSYQPQREQKPEDLLLNLLKQLAREQLAVPTEVRDLYEPHKSKGTRPALDDIVRALHSTVQLYSKVFVVIDALDEYHVSNSRGQKTLLSEVFRLQNQLHVNLFATSRYILQIMSEFNECLRKDIRAQDDDISSYVDMQIPQLLRSRISKHEDYPKLQHMIRSEVVKAADGMYVHFLLLYPQPINANVRFLIPRLHMDSLMSEPTRGDIKRALRNLPQGAKGLDETYEQAMRRIEGQEKGYRELAKQVLSWVTYSRRALSTAEVQHALAVRADMTDMDEDFLPEIEILGSICAGLITVDEKSDVIRLVHYTTQEYFERASSFPNAHTDLAVACVTYLSFDTFETGFCPTGKEFDARLHLNPLYDYAARNWGYHVRRASTDVQYSTPRFLESEAKIASSSQAMMANALFYDYSQDVPRKLTGLHLVAYFGLLQITAVLLKKGYQSNLQDSYGRTPLSWAAAEGHEAVVQALLARDDVDPDSKDGYGQTPLSWAAEGGHEAVVRALLARDDVDPNSKGSDDQTPLSWAAEGGHEAVVQALLARDDVDPNSKDSNGRTPLSRAAGNGHEAVVQALLAQDDVDPDSKDSNGRTPLSWAAARRHGAVVQALLAQDDVDPDYKDWFGRTPLSWATARGHEAVVQMLLARDDVDPDSKKAV